MQPNLSHGLREILTAVVSSSQSDDQVNRLVSVSHVLASAFVKSKIAARTVNIALLGLSPADAAYDCIADLFRRDDRGDLVQIKAYFEGIVFARLTDVELLTHLRRLVFSKVNHGLFRMYNESDPILGKILRNIKLALETLQSFVEVDRFGEPCLAPSMSDLLYHLPPVDQTQLERDLRSVAHPSDHVPALMAKLSLLLRQQEETCRVVPLMTIALIFRAIYMDRADAHEHIEEPGYSFSEGEARTAILEACRRTKLGARIKYVEGGKIDDELLQHYFSVIQRSLLGKMVDHDGTDCSYFAGLKDTIPTLTLEEYRQTHKSRIEYLGRIAYEEAVRQLRKGFGPC